MIITNYFHELKIIIFYQQLFPILIQENGLQWRLNETSLVQILNKSLQVDDITMNTLEDAIKTTQQLGVQCTKGVVWRLGAYNNDVITSDNV